MSRQNSSLRERYSFTDYLYYTSLGAVPTFTAFYAIARHTSGGVFFYLFLWIAAVALIYRFYCSHCPHYTREGRTTRCMFFWGAPKLFKSRPGPLSLSDKAISIAAPAVLIVFPLYWLSLHVGLLIIYILSLVGFMATVKRNECKRCIYFDCPVNQVPEELKSHADAA